MLWNSFLLSAAAFRNSMIPDDETPSASGTLLGRDTGGCSLLNPAGKMKIKNTAKPRFLMVTFIMNDILNFNQILIHKCTILIHDDRLDNKEIMPALVYSGVR